MRLVDADVLRRELIKGHDLIGAKYVDLAPDIDAVPVVRCKDCKHYDIEIPSRCIKDRCYCATVDSFMKTTDYCSYAERRSDE
jgi:hypothetical protein